MLVGVSAAGGGTNVKVDYPYEWATASRPSSPINGLSGYNTDLSQWEYWNGSAWVQFAAGGSGTVNTGAINELAYYAANGTAVSGLTTGDNHVLVTNGSGVPSLSSTLPSALNIPQPNIVGVTTNSNAASGSVGEFISSVITSPVSFPLGSTDLTSISLTAGDWDVYGNITFSPTIALGAAHCWTSATSATFPGDQLANNLQTITNAISNIGLSAPFQRYSLATTTTIYLTGDVGFASGTCSGVGGIYARRVR